jgi:hypothetical protein
MAGARQTGHCHTKVVASRSRRSRLSIVHDGTWWGAGHRPEKDRRPRVAGTLTVIEDGRGPQVLPFTTPPLLIDPSTAFGVSPGRR